MKERLAREARGEHGGISRTQQRFIDTGAVLKQLCSIDAGKWPTAEDDDEMVIELMDAPSQLRSQSLVGVAYSLSCRRRRRERNPGSRSDRH
jgi:hypothetical protein